MTTNRNNERPLFSPQLSAGNTALKDVFRHDKSAGNNNQDLARILVVLQFCFTLFNWMDAGGKELIDALTAYQASVDGKYHDDFKAIATIEELDYRIATRHSRLLGQQQQTPSIAQSSQS